MVLAISKTKKQSFLPISLYLTGAKLAPCNNIGFLKSDKYSNKMDKTVSNSLLWAICPIYGLHSHLHFGIDSASHRIDSGNIWRNMKAS